MRYAQGYATISGMAETKRKQDEIARQNLVYVIEACSRRLGKARGGVVYLARLIGTQDTYLSQVANHYKGRNVGRELKDKIESKFGLDADWMDHEHDESVVEWLVSRVPSLPHQRNKGTQAFQPGYGKLVDTIAELQRQIDELKSQLESKPNTRK